MRFHAPLKPDYVIRIMGEADFDALRGIREIAGPGFTSLMMDDVALKERLALSERSFAASPSAPGSERYTLGLEHLKSGTLVGTAAVKSTVGSDPPFFNFRVLTIAQASHAAGRRFDMDVLILVNEFTGCSEVGSLFVQPAHRASGIGRALAQSRYLLIGAAPERFNDRVVSELRGVVSADGVSPFWEALGRHFFKMEFLEADRLSATTDNQFILDLMPKYPIYVDMLPQSARDVIGQCHPDGAGARRLLEWEGFRFDHVVDIFEGGPLVSVSRDAIRTAREARRLTIGASETLKTPRPTLISVPQVSAFRAVSALASAEGDTLTAHPETLAALKIEAGDTVFAWMSDES